MPKTSTRYVCQACGAASPKWSGRCDDCGAWNSFIEEQITSTATRGGSATRVTTQPLRDVEARAHQRLLTNIEDLNQVLGGGIVPGSVTLLSGDPGIGKSTLVLQVAANLADTYRVLYVSGEESASQIKLRADRLGVAEAQLEVVSDTNVDDIAATIEAEKYGLVIIDSIQTMATSTLTSSPGTVSQITASAQRLAAVAKHMNAAMLIIGHITKDGNIAGPKVLEHLVDVVLYLEGDKYGSFKALRGVKNRFGSTNEVGIFEMSDRGLTTVVNPSAALLAERQPGPGSVVFATVEGSRPLLIEVQALVTTSNFGYPKRTAVGFDLNRLNLLVAVLMKRAGLNLSNQDVYVNIVGGLRIAEPAADLAIILSIVSAFKNHSIDQQIVTFGEVGLNGEIRSVHSAQKRLSEAQKLGFARAIGPRGLKHKDMLSAANIGQAVEMALSPTK